MRLGVTLPTRLIPLARVPEMAREAEEAGLDAVWDWELYRNPFTMLAMSAQVTSRVGFGTGIAIAANRSPFEMANAAADVDELCGGRMLLGLGSGDVDFVNALHGTPLAKPLTRTSEFIDVLRLAWRYLGTGEAPDYAGEFHSFTAPPFNPSGVRHLERPSIPIVLGVMGPNMLRLAGRKADGWIGYLYTPGLIREHVRPAIAEAGRDPSEVTLVVELICAVHPDREVARLRGRRQVGFYACHPASAVMVAHEGLTDEVDALRAALLSEGVAALDRTPDGLVDAFSLTGTPDEVRDRLTEWEDVIDHLVLHTPYVPPITAEESEDAYRWILEAVRR